MADYDHQGHRERLKNRFLNEGGFENFEEHNILELLLFYTIPRKDTNELAHRILDRFGSLSAVFDAPLEELTKVDGVSKNTACLFKAIVPAARAYSKSKYVTPPSMSNFAEASEYLLGKYLGVTEEMFAVVSLDNRNAILSFDVVAKGAIDNVNIDTRKMVNMLINNKATSAMLVHNHPSGFAVPSQADLSQTRELVETLYRVGIRVVDHIIVAENRCVSLRNVSGYKNLFDRYETNY